MDKYSTHDFLVSLLVRHSPLPLEQHLQVPSPFRNQTYASFRGRETALKTMNIQLIKSSREVLEIGIRMLSFA